MKALVIVMMCALVQLTTVNAQVLNEFATVSKGDAVVTTEEKVVIPDVMNLNEADALAALEAVVLPDGSAPEIIKTYEYSAEVAADMIYEQSPVGEVAAETAGQIYISVSLGEEPNEMLTVATKEVDPFSTFGLARYIEPVADTTESRMGIGWGSLPESYEYNWDNSANCWYHGVWVDGVCYKTPEGTYSTDVRHKVQLYCDGEYVYLRVVFSRDYGSKFNGEQYHFWIDDQPATFQVEYVGGGSITNNPQGLGAGTHQLEVHHANGSMSSQIVPGAEAYLTKHDSDVNAVLEVKIPMSEMQRQNPNIDLENIGWIEFSCPNLTGNRRVRASGASTFPMASAGLALLVIPGSTMLLKKYGKKKAKDSNE